MSDQGRLYASLATARVAGVPTARAAPMLDHGERAGSLPDLIAWPCWPALSQDARGQVWRLTALDVLPEAIDGATPRALAAAVGEDRLEAALDLLPGGDAPLPAAAALSEMGRRIANGALPAPLAARLGVTGEAGDAAAVAAAETIAP